MNGGQIVGKLRVERVQHHHLGANLLQTVGAYLLDPINASVTALTLGLAVVAGASAQAPSYSIGQGPFGHPHLRPQTPGQSQPPGQATAPSQAQTPPGWGRAPSATLSGNGVAMVQVVSSEAEAFRLQSLSGKPLRGSGQETLGTISDFLIEPQSGALRFAVVPSGAGGSGETYRIIPISALDPISSTEGLRISLGRAWWDQVGTDGRAAAAGQDHDQ